MAAREVAGWAAVAMVKVRLEVAALGAVEMVEAALAAVV